MEQVGTSLGKCGVTIWLVGNYLDLKSMGEVGLIMGNIRIRADHGSGGSGLRSTHHSTHLDLVEEV